MAVRMSALHASHPLPPGRFLVLIYVRVWVDPRAIVQLEGLGQLKNPMTSLGIKPMTFWLVAQCLNQLLYDVPQLSIIPWKCMSWERSVSIVTGWMASIQQGEEIFLFSIASRPALRPVQPHIQWVPEALSWGINRPGREADHSPPSNAEAKNGGATSPLPHISSWHAA
jgi:hypothetical protein